MARGKLHLVAARPLAAPASSVISGGVEEIKAAGGIRTAFQPRPVAVTETMWIMKSVLMPGKHRRGHQRLE
jgi:hypothetical protein